MYSSVRREIPEFLADEVVYCDNLILSRTEKFCLLLTRNLHLYEFQRKQLRRSIDLNESCLLQVAERLREYRGFKGKWFECRNTDPREETTSKDVQGLLRDMTFLPTQDAPSTPEICLGKYVYSSLGTQRLYVLLRCWDKLLILHRLVAEDEFKLVEEYESVIGYKLVHGPLKYQALLEIEFKDKPALRTDLQCEQSTKRDGEPGQLDKSEFKQLLERVRSTQTELQVHRAITRREMQRLRALQTFGCDLLRSHKLEEKQMLTRCGDVWWRFTAASDALVLGVPLVNSCAPPNLTIVRNLRPVLLPASETDSHSLRLQFRLCRLQTRFADIDSLPMFEQADSWTISQEAQLPPDTYAVLLIRLDVADLLSLGVYALLLLYDIEKNLELGKEPQPRTFEQQLHLRQIDFRVLLEQRQTHEVTFSARTLHQDLLAVACTAHTLRLRVRYAAPKDAQLFERLLVSKFDFHATNDESDPLQIDDEATPSDQKFPHKVFYNRQPTSLWHGLVALKEAPIAAADPLKIVWKFYAPNEPKACLLLKLLFADLLLHKCNIEQIEQVVAQGDGVDVPVVALEDALRQELQAQLQLLNLKPNDEQLKDEFERLLGLQLKSDLLAASTKLSNLS